MWDGVGGPLRERGWDVLAPTLPVGAERRTMAEWAEDVFVIADGTLIPVGVSVGGYLSFELWRRAPERVAALVLCDTRATPEPDEGMEGRARSIETLRAGGPAALWADMEDRVLGASADREVRGRAREIVLGRDPEELVATVEAIRDRPDSRETVGSISAPALVVVGEEDRFLPVADAAALATALPEGRLRVVPAAGHVPPLERPEAFTAILSAFLEEVTA
jgi:3-oxoadipate enol-lactonase